MRVLVHGASLDADAERMRLAAAGLALRGHHVAWSGPGIPAGLRETGAIEPAGGRRGARREAADVVLGGPRRPLATAVEGWFAGAHAMLLALDPAIARRWTLPARWAWGTLASGGMLAGETPAEEGAALWGVPLTALGRWSELPPPAIPDAAHPDTEALERTAERWLARRRGHAARGGAFLDRDGTVIVEKNYLSDPAEVELLGDTPHALHRLHVAGYTLVVVSNQAGVGRGYFTLARAYEVMARLRRELRVRGVELDAIYFCPHAPDAGCECRKPGALLLRQAAANLNLSLRRSAMIGDRWLDVDTGHNAGTAGILVRTGYGAAEERVPHAGRPPEFVADDLAGAAEWLAARTAFPE